MAGGKGGQTMSGREIAELTGKLRAHVMRDTSRCLRNYTVRMASPNLGATASPRTSSILSSNQALNG